MTAPAALSARGISKTFGDLVANRDLDLDVMPGEIHALLGENGSGKTTLLSILYGLLSPDQGQLAVRGQAVSWTGPQDAREHGIALVPQQFRLVPTLSVAENVLLTTRKRGAYQTLLRDVTARLTDLQARYGLKLDPTATVGTLGIGERQRVEVLRALYFTPAVLLLDEPTSVLTPQEAEALYEALLGMVKQEGLAVVVTTHRLAEIFAIADRVTVLRNGEKVESFNAGAFTREALIQAMIGHRPRPEPVAGARQSDETPRGVLRVNRLALSAPTARARAVPPIHELDLEIPAGEIFGIAGVEGNGQLSLELILAGLLPPTVGQALLFDAERDQWVSLWLKAGSRGVDWRRVGYIPSDRTYLGVAAELTVRENLLLHELAATPALARAPATRGDRTARLEALIREFGIEPPQLDIPVRQLSGGNAQKVVLARELSRNPRLTLAAQPTMGLDVAATALVRARLREQARRGGGVLIISSDLDELLELCDRIAVMFRGRLGRPRSRDRFDAHAIGAEMGGETDQ